MDAGDSSIPVSTPTLHLVTITSSQETHSSPSNHSPSTPSATDSSTAAQPSTTGDDLNPPSPSLLKTLATVAEYLMPATTSTTDNHLLTIERVAKYLHHNHYKSATTSSNPLPLLSPNATYATTSTHPRPRDETLPSFPSSDDYFAHHHHTPSITLTPSSSIPPLSAMSHSHQRPNPSTSPCAF
ncbi:hypothetical protein L6452_06486 [Arctium lappa]|uniref:Uncharacterized protein n=1 Tax=Arctium lappa TaxID=4217 RepID=A0ACB9EK02_ARCLA|nr:hypothetical protein L6452_06486 [Arctium lappa]